jgi:hypothetical protein
MVFLLMAIGILCTLAIFHSWVVTDVTAKV